MRFSSFAQMKTAPSKGHNKKPETLNRRMSSNRPKCITLYSSIPTSYILYNIIIIKMPRSRSLLVSMIKVTVIYARPYILLNWSSVCQRLLCEQRAIRMNDGGDDGAVDFSPGNEIKVQFSSWLAIYGRRFPTPELPPRRHLQSRYEIEWRKSSCTYILYTVLYDVVWWWWWCWYTVSAVTHIMWQDDRSYNLRVR